MKKYLVIFLMSLLFLSLGSCKSKFTYDSLDKVTYENLTSLKDKSYIVVVYQANCSNCEDLKPTIEKYYKYTLKHDDAPKIYSLNVNLAINNKMVIDADDTYPNMIGTTDYKKIKIKTTPSILIITNGALTKVISDYTTNRPVTEGKNYFQNLMK